MKPQDRRAAKMGERDPVVPGERRIGDEGRPDREDPMKKRDCRHAGFDVG